MTTAHLTPRTTPATRDTIDECAHRIAADGITAHEPEVAEIVRSARKAGFVSHLLDLLADRRQPAIARERAYGQVAGHIAVALSQADRPYRSAA